VSEGAGQRGYRRLIVISLDGLATADYEIVRGLPSFRRLLRRGALCRRLRGIYPTQTYALHATALTGARPARHGILANSRFQPGRERPEWFWYRQAIRLPTLCDRAMEASLSTASLFWPTAGRSGQRWVLPEIMPGHLGVSLAWRALAAGTPLFLLDMLRRYGSLLRGLDRYHLDNFTAAVAAHLARSDRGPDLLLVHLLDLDAVRHREGFQGPAVERALQEEDLRLARILEAALHPDGWNRTAVVVFGDHAFLDVHTAVNLNTALARAGFIRLDRRGRCRGWLAWANTAEGSAHLYLRDREDRSLRRRVGKLLENLRADPRHGIEEVYRGTALRRLGLGQAMDFVLEARPGFYFSPLLRPEVSEPAPAGQRACHGYRPDREGYTSLLLGAGAGLRAGAELQEMSILDLGPTLAALLGLDLPEAEGRVRKELLEAGEAGGNDA
jgi:predicted AlkP superfamily pyrophosphatase or phosphodiesterase